MAINPLDILASVPPTRKTTHQQQVPTSRDGSFADMLLQQAQGDPSPLTTEKAQAMAELMRLEQMRAVIDSAGPAEQSRGEIIPRAMAAKFFETFAPQGTTGSTTASPLQQAALAAPPTATTLPAPTSSTGSTPVAIEPPKTLQQIISNAAQRYGVDERLIRSVIKAESNFNPRAVSHAGAQGLMQLMPATARGLGVTDPFDPQQNVMAGTRFLKEMLNRYNGNIDSALAAYNWGPGNVDRKGMALPRETRDYLAKVKTYYQQMA